MTSSRVQPVDITLCTRADYDEILIEIEEFWGSKRTLAVHHPMFLYEFGNSAYVVRDAGKVVSYLFGFISQTEPTAYVHLVGVRSSHRRQGLARRLYQHFIEFARERGCTALKAITTPGNKESIAFHRSLGMKPLGEPNPEGIHVVQNYSGQGQDRVVFTMKL